MLSTAQCGGYKTYSSYTMLTYLLVEIQKALRTVYVVEGRKARNTAVNGHGVNTQLSAIC